MNDFKKGEKVSWDSSGGSSKGVVVKRVTEPTKVKGFTAKASKEHPEYMVKSSKSGKMAVHKPKELRKEHE